VTGTLDLLAHGFTCTLPSCQIFWTCWKRSLASARKQAEISKHVLACVFEQGENDAWPWIGEKPAPLTRLKAGSSQGTEPAFTSQGDHDGPFALCAPDP